MPVTEQEVTVLGTKVKVKLRASGRKSSEGDGRTAADIERELAQAKQQQKDS